MVALFFLITGLYCGDQSRIPPSSPYHVSKQIMNAGNQELITIGTIQRLYGFNGTSSRCDIELHSMRTVSNPFVTTHGLVRFTLPALFPAEIMPGDTVAIRAQLKKPPIPLVPGSFDYPAYLAKHDIYVIGFISSPLHIQKVVKPQKEVGPFHTLRYWPERLRTKINRFIDANLAGDTASIYKALLTGDRSSVAPQIIEHFKGAGVLHILAISGLHMSLLGVFCYGFFFYLLRRSTWLIYRINTRKTAAFLCILPLLFYTLIAGAKTPVVRSFIMSLVVIIAICYGRKHSFGSLLACAALAILFLSPEELFTPSFQLSFAAVMAIAAAAPFIIELSNALITRIGDIKGSVILKWIITGVMVSMAATLGTAPLLMYHFNRISLVGVAANLVVEPLLCLWSLLLGFIAIMLMVFWQSAAAALLKIGGLGISLANEATSFFYTLPLSSLFLPSPSVFHLAIYYLCLCQFFFLKGFRSPAKIVFTTFFILIFLTMLVPFKEYSKDQQTDSVLNFLAVGHGSSTLIEMVGGKRVLIDAGALSSPGFDVGRSTIAPFLLTKGITKIDDIVITHPDSDHYNGALFLLQHFKVDNLWISTLMNKEKGWLELLKVAKENGTNIIVGKPGQYIARNNTNALMILANTANNGAARSDNDLGLILKYVHQDFSVIFPGDISVTVEKELVKKGLDLAATVLLAPHHGSATSNSNLFLETVGPEMLIVSASRNSNLCSPNTELAIRCRKLGIRLVPLNKVGTATIVSGAGGFSLKTYVQSNVMSLSDLPATITHR